MSEATVGPGTVVVLQVSGEGSAQVLLVEDERAVEEFAAEDADHSLAVCWLWGLVADS